MEYRRKCTQKIRAELAGNGNVKKSPYRDFFDGSDYLKAVEDGRITTDNMVLMLSIDGAQLYRNKTSECWIYIWVIFDHAPGVRYRKTYVLIGGFIPGPNKPKNVDSFLFPGLHHLSAIQREGLRIWDADLDRIFTSHPFLALATADDPGMACINGFVGHHGRVHCRFYCPIVGRHKPGASHYYPARLKPSNYVVAGCDHPDINLNTLLSACNSRDSKERYDRNLVKVVNSESTADYGKNRLETGICKPSIFSGLPAKHILGIPGCFSSHCGEEHSCATKQIVRTRGIGLF